MAWVDWNDHVYRETKENQKFWILKTRFLRTLVDFTVGLLELERDWLMSRVRLLVEVRVNLNIGCRRDINWGLRGGDGGRVRICHLAG